jgi:hypothetical protein
MMSLIFIFVVVVPCAKGAMSMKLNLTSRVIAGQSHTDRVATR